jgi:porin
VQWNLKQLPGSKAVEAPIPTPNGPVQRQLPTPLLQIGGIRANTSLESPDAGSIGAGENWGAYGSLTLPVQLPLALDHRIWISGRVGFNPQNNPAPTYFGVGWLGQGVIPGRPVDVMALGFGRTSFSPAITPSSSYEAVVELNYNYTVNSNLSLQPLVQWIVNPGGMGTTPGIFATGLQLTLQF